MARPRDTPIGVEDIRRYLEAESDFDFELKVLHALTQMGLKCEHGGHYEDPVTKKSREFDIRLRKSEAGFHLFAAIECKNLRANFPLLVSCVPRAPSEAWHQIVLVEDKLKGPGILSVPTLEGRSKLHMITDENTRYRVGGFVGKSTAQVGITLQDEIVSHDKEFYEKWGQSLSSLHNFGSEIEELPHDSLAMALPVVVVPDGRLWQAAYAADGTRVRDPEQVDHCAVYAGGAEIPLFVHERLPISHVEIMTFRGLMLFVHTFLRDADSMRRLLLGSLHP